MIATISPSSIKGDIRAPRSKSDMQRACAAALLHLGTTTIHDPGRSNDDQAALDVISKLGATVVDKGSVIEIASKGIDSVSDQLNCGESGLGIRMFTPIAALSSKPLIITGSGSLVKRPMDFFDEIFPQLHIKIQSEGGKLPLAIQGPLTPKTITVDGSLSSQFLTGLLMAFSAANAKGVTIHVKDLKSKPYIDLTLSVLQSFGMKIPYVLRYEEFIFDDTDHVQPSGDFEYHVEGDWSGAAFLFVAGAISGDIRILGMRADSVQADRKILEAITDAGAKLQLNDGVYQVGPGQLKAFSFDATECPDLFPPLVALAAYCEGVTTITGALRLTHKESNRALTLQDVFGKMGIQIDLEEDLMKVHGGMGLKSAEIHSHHDHRIAMAAAVAALGADGPVTIEDAEAIDKSYPEFYVDLRRLGTGVSLRKF
jgi:3-phosphoshikimate 1-carboxyvinyltransferase